MQGEMTGGAAKYASRGIWTVLLRQLIPALAGFALSRVKILGALTPFGTALVSAAPSGSMVSAVIGCIIGSVIPGGADDALRAIATAIAAAGVRWALSEVRSIGTSPVFIPGTAFFVTLMTGLTVTLSAGREIGYQAVLYVAEGLISAACAYFISGAVIYLTARRIRSATRTDIVCLLATSAIVFIPLCRIRIAGYSPMAAILLLCVLLAARWGGESYGAIAGTAAGMVLLLSGSDAVHAGIAAAAGLTAAIFMPVGSIAASIAFVSVCAIGTLASGELNIFFTAQALTAAVIFALLRPELTDRLFSRISVDRHTETDRRKPPAPCADVSRRLISAAEGLSGVSDTVCKVSQRLETLDKPDPERIYRQATQKVCRDCAISSHCWGEIADETRSELSGLTDILRRDGSLSRANTPAALSGRCARWGELCDEINRLYADFAARESARRRVSQVRSVIAGQLGGVSEMLCDLAQQTGERIDSDPMLIHTVSQTLRDAGYPVSRLQCVRGASGQLAISADITDIEEDAADADELADMMSGALDADFALPQLPDIRRPFTLELRQCPPLSVEFGAYQHRCSGEQLCGDAYEAFSDGDSGAVMMISDGMGSGGRAAVDAAMTCGLLCRLLRAGFGIHGAMRVVNSSLLVKSDDESLATVDCARIDLYSGEARFCKAGAAQSFVRQGGAVRQVNIPSLPLGIMREPDCDSASVTLSPGDIVVMVSDGAITDDGQWIEEALLGYCGDMRTLARRIVSLARTRRGDDDDDITALVWRVNLRQ